jgi:hypothetical protein
MLTAIIDSGKVASRKLKCFPFREPGVPKWRESAWRASQSGAESFSKKKRLGEEPKPFRAFKNPKFTAC